MPYICFSRNRNCQIVFKGRNGQTRFKCAFPKLEMAKMKPGLALLNSLYGTKGKRTVFGNLWGGPHVAAQTNKKWKEMKAQKAKMKGSKSPKGQNEKNEGPKGQNKRKWTPKRPKWKEMKARKAKMKGNEGRKGQNERKWKPKRPKNWKMQPVSALIKFV